MGIGSIIGGATSLVSGIMGSDAASSAANAQASSANNATAQQQQMFNTLQGNMLPYMQQGKTSLGQLNQYMNASGTGGPGGGPGLLHAFGASDLNANMAPNYQFQLGQGMGQLSNQSAAAGGAGGGNAFAGEQAYAQNMAGSAYQNAYNNYNNNQQNIYSRLGNLAQLGQASGTNSALGGSAFAGGMANTIVGAGNAQAAGIMGSNNALASGLSGAAGYGMMGMLNGGGMGGYTPQGSSAYPTFNPQTVDSGTLANQFSGAGDLTSIQPPSF